MRTSSITDQRVGVLGFGVEGRSIVRALRRWGHRRTISVFVDGETSATLAAPAGTHDANLAFVDATAAAANEGAAHPLGSIDWLIRSPGIRPSHPLLVAAAVRGVSITTSTNLFLERARAAELPVIGITGSKGKSTTSTLVHRSLVACGIDAILAGNIGQPCLDELDDVLARRATTVLELSSYQCNDLVLGPSIGVVLCLFPEHLDWHGSLSAYYDAKLRLASTQRADDVVIFHGADRELVARQPLGPGRHLRFRGPRTAAREADDRAPDEVDLESGWFRHRGHRLFEDRMSLRGAHNRLNAAAALAAVSAAGVDLVARASELSDAVCSFDGLPHRLEVVGIHGRIRWVNDSISTAPEAAVAALEAFGNDVRSIIVGGHDRGYDFTPLADEIVRRKIPFVAALPSSGLRLAEVIERRRAAGDLDGASITVFAARDLPDAVSWCARHTPSGATCLFSPASPSYGVYRDFQERGEHLRREVRELGS